MDNINGKMVGDDNCKRIEWLLENKLTKVALSPVLGAWEILYVDDADGRYWEKMYPWSGVQGGGPPTLISISSDIAKNKYKI